MLTIAVRILEAMFVLGILGSAVVVVLTSIEDFATLFKTDSKTSPAEVPSAPVIGHSANPQW
jgi:hypothetical protein